MVWVACCSIDVSIRQHSDRSLEQQRSLPVVQVQEVTLEWLRVLRAQAGSLKVRFSELDQLCQAISAVEAFQVCLGSRMQLQNALWLQASGDSRVFQLHASNALCWLQHGPRRCCK